MRPARQSGGVHCALSGAGLRGAGGPHGRPAGLCTLARECSRTEDDEAFKQRSQGECP